MTPEPIIDIAGQPPTNSHLAKLRAESTVVKRKTEIYKRYFKNICYGFIILVVLTLLTLWSTEKPTLDPAIFVIMLVTGLFFGIGIGANISVVVSVILFTFVTVIAIVTSEYDAVVTLGWIVVTMLTAASARFYIHFVEIPLDKANHLLTNLCELNASEYPDLCIAYDEFRGDTEVERYHNQLAATGRKPVVAEYEATKAWVESTEARQIEAKAITACERMTA